MLRLILHSLVSGLILLYFPAVGFCNMKIALAKYLHSTISANQLEKLSCYNYLIDYYSSFSYFQQHVKVNPDFIRALILAESACEPAVISEKNAVGLCQILFTTGKRAAFELAQMPLPLKYIDRNRLQHLKKEDLFDPAINILLACYLISKYNNKYDGKLDLVLTAWNAGDSNQSLDFGLPASSTETTDLIGKVNGYFIFLLDQH